MTGMPDQSSSPRRLEAARKLGRRTVPVDDRHAGLGTLASGGPEQQGEVAPARLGHRRAEVLGAAVAPDRRAGLQLDDSKMHRRSTDPWGGGDEDQRVV